jgi:hypothetical protein
MAWLLSYVSRETMTDGGNTMMTAPAPNGGYLDQVRTRITLDGRQYLLLLDSLLDGIHALVAAGNPWQSTWDLREEARSAGVMPSTATTFEFFLGAANLQFELDGHEQILLLDALAHAAQWQHQKGDARWRDTWRLRAHVFSSPQWLADETQFDTVLPAAGTVVVA